MSDEEDAGPVSTREQSCCNPTKKTMPEDDHAVNGGKWCRMKRRSTEFGLMENSAAATRRRER